MRTGVSKHLKRVNLTPQSVEAKQAINQCRLTCDIDQLIELTKHEDPAVRATALREMCPCHLREDIEPFWQRIFEMTEDDNLFVRKQLFHVLCDGSPQDKEDKIIQAVESFNSDEDLDLRRMCHKVMAHYRKTGKWNIL